MQYAAGIPVRKMTVQQFSKLTSTVPLPKKNIILSFMRNAPIIATPSLPVHDRMTGEEVFPANNAYSDGIFTWYESDIYHFEKYNLKLNDDFIQHVLNRPE